MRLRPFWGKKRNAGVSASGPRAPVDLFSDGKGTVVVMHRSEPRSSAKVAEIIEGNESRSSRQRPPPFVAGVSKLGIPKV
jgi:hypothetical protein